MHINLKGLQLAKAIQSYSRVHWQGPPRTCVSRAGGSMAREANIVVISDRESPDLKALEKLPKGANIVAIGQYEDILGLHKEELGKVNVLLSTGFGVKTAQKKGLDKIWSSLPGLKWMHCSSAGITHVLTEDLVKSDVILTNAKGTFSHSLGEYGITACLYFAKKIPELQANQRASKWAPLYVEELRSLILTILNSSAAHFEPALECRGKTLGVVGYGDIGQATARIARVFGMKILALRRRTELSDSEEKQGLKVYTPDKLNKMLAASDYVVTALPATPATNKFVSAEAIASLQSHAVFVNVGRGTTVDEDALIQALKEKKIRGAALDVFAEEPLAESSPLWELDNVLISPHCGDRTTTFLSEAVEQFVDNVKLYVEGKDVVNQCDKEAGY